MASGFMSSVVTRLFHSKEKRKAKDRQSSHVDNVSGTREKPLKDKTLPPSTQTPAAEREKSGQVKLRDRTRKTKKRDTPHPRPPNDEAETARTTPQAKRKSPIFASLRKRTRPLSCFVARPESPTELQDATRGTDRSDSKTAAPSKDTKARREREEAKHSASRQPKEKKPRRPLSCIVQPPSPRSSVVDMSPNLEDTRDAGRHDSGLQREVGYEARSQQRSPRPVSCFVGTPPQRSPPPYSRRPLRSSPLDSSGPEDSAAGTFRVGSPSRHPGPPAYLEAANRSYSPSHLPAHQLPAYDSPSPGSVFNYPEARQQYDYEENQVLQPPYFCDVPQNSPLNHAENPQKAYDQRPLDTSPHYGRIPEQSPAYRHHPESSYFDEIPRQSTPDMGSRDRCYSPTARRFDPAFTEPAQSWGNRSYDLKSYFPSVAPARCAPRPRPQSACFLCEPQPCCMEVRRPYRPMSQCFVPGCNLPWNEDPVQNIRPREDNPSLSGPASLLHRDEPVPVDRLPLSEQPNKSEIPEQVTTSLQEAQLDGTHPAGPPEGEEASPTAEPSLEVNDAQTTRLLSPTSEGAASQSYLPLTSSPLSSPSTAPRAGKRTIFPRPKSACLTMAEQNEFLAIPPKTRSPLSLPTSSAEPTAKPRPKSACLLSSEPESLPTRSNPPSVPSPQGRCSFTASPPPPRFRLHKFRSAECLDRVDEDDCLEASPPPSPPPPRSRLQKYRSADCLDCVDEAACLTLSPPPAKPLSHFTDSTSSNGQEGKDNHISNPNKEKTSEEIFTSTEMLEKLGQPRFRKQQQGPNKCRPVSCFVGSASDESGYLSNATLGGSDWLGGLSASTGDILEILEAGGGEEMNDEAADDELSFERAGSLRKAWSVCTLLRQDSIQDRSFTVMRKRRQKMKDRRHTTNQRSSSTETDEGVDLKTGHSASSLLQEKRGVATEEEGGESSVVAGIPLDRKLLVPSSWRDQVVRRLHSVHMKAWEIRLRRKQIQVKRRSCERLHPRRETLV